jgi:hypothetical protein
MANRELNALEKAFIVQHAYRAEKRRDEPEKIRADEETIQEIFECSPWSIAGLKAELTKRIERRRQQPDTLKKTDVSFARSYIGLAGSPREQEELRDEVANLLQVDLPAILKITGDTRRQSKITIEGLDIPIKGELPFASLGEVPLLRGGAHADYDTPERDKIRHVWSGAIDQAIPQSVRSKVYGLILPGKRCLDVPHYLRLGIPPRNIIGVENGDDVEPRIALAEFTFNAQKYDISYFREDLNDFLRHFRQRLSFAVIDMTGQMCPSYLNIAANLPLSERSVVIFNTWPRREHREYQDELKRMWIYSGLPEEEYTLERAREFCPAQINAGAARNENWYFGEKMLEDLPLTKEARAMNANSPRAKMERNLETVVRPMLRSIVQLINEHGLLEGGKKSEQVCDEVVDLLQNMFKDVTFGDAYIQDLKKYWYSSGIANTPFHTDIGVIRTPKSLYHEISKPSEFLMACARKCLRLLGEEQLEATQDAVGRFKFAIMRGRDFVAPGTAKKNDRLVCLLDGRVVDYKPVHAFLNAARSYHTFRGECPDDSWQSQIAIERTEVA